MGGFTWGSMVCDPTTCDDDAGIISICSSASTDIGDGWWECLALLPFLARLARSGFWIRAWEIVWVIPSDWHFVLHLQGGELLLELCKLASSSVIFELACANFLSAFWQRSLSVEALFSPILTLSVRLSWQVAIPLDFLIQLRGCFILYVANNVWPCISEGLFNLPWWYFYHWLLWCFYDMQSICFAHITSFMMCCGNKIGHPVDVPGFGLESSFENLHRSL